MDEVNYESLRRIQQKERASGMLTELPRTFYSHASQHITNLRKQIKQDFRMDKAKEYENTVKILRDIISMRRQKLLLRAVRAASDDQSPHGISEDEECFFKEVKSRVKENEMVFEAFINPPDKPDIAICEVPPKEPEAKPQTGTRLRFIREIPQFVGADMQKYGPFKQGEVLCVPDEVADLLLKRSIAERFE